MFPFPKTVDIWQYSLTSGSDGVNFVTDVTLFGQPIYEVRYSSKLHPNYLGMTIYMFPFPKTVDIWQYSLTSGSDGVNLMV